MRISRYNLMIVLPIVLSVVVYILIKDPYTNTIRGMFIRGKELTDVPDFQIVDMEETLKGLEILSKIKFPAKDEVAEYGSEESDLEPPNYKLTFTFVGKKRYAIIDGQVYREGDKLKYEKIVKIEKGKVLLEGRWGKRWVYLLDH